MRRLSLAGFFVVCAVALAQIASAADLPRKAPPAAAPPPWSWTGWYIGANIGYGWGDSTDPQLTVVNPGSAGNIGPFLGSGLPGFSSGNLFPDLNPSGVFGGAQLGYDHQLGKWLLGAVADIQAANFEDSQVVTTPAATTCCNADESLKARMNWFGTVRGKLGYTANDWLVYATGGLAYGRVTSDIGFACTPGGIACGGINFSGSRSETKAGWAAGAGVAYHVPGTRASIGLEYLHIDLGRSSVTALDQTTVFPTTTVTESQRFANELLRFTVNFKL